MSMLYPTKEEAYDAYRRAPDAFFEAYHRQHFDDRELISPEWTWFETKYHYNLVENGIIDLLREARHPIRGARVLDVGSGTGHWLDYYDRILEAREVVGTDFSSVSVELLASRFSDRPNVGVRCVDVSGPDTAELGKFDVVNAIGVLFHIVDDEKWAAAVANMVAALDQDGVAIVGGDFGAKTEELGVMRKVRSLDVWRTTLEAAGAEVVGCRYFDWFKGGVNPGLKNNLLAFRRAKGSAR